MIGNKIKAITFNTQTKLPAHHQNMACAYLDKEYGAFTTFAKMIDIYTAFWFGDRYGAAKMHWDLLMELSYPP